MHVRSSGELRSRYAAQSAHRFTLYPMTFVALRLKTKRELNAWLWRQCETVAAWLQGYISRRMQPALFRPFSGALRTTLVI